jgi:hypothetical protein
MMLFNSKRMISSILVLVIHVRFLHVVEEPPMLPGAGGDKTTPTLYPSPGAGDDNPAFIHQDDYSTPQGKIQPQVVSHIPR